MARPLFSQRAIERPVASSRRVVSLLISALTLTPFVSNVHAQYRFDQLASSACSTVTGKCKSASWAPPSSASVYRRLSSLRTFERLMLADGRRLDSLRYMLSLIATKKSFQGDS